MLSHAEESYVWARLLSGVWAGLRDEFLFEAPASAQAKPASALDANAPRVPRARTRPRTAGATRPFATFAVNVIAAIVCLWRVRAQPPRRELCRDDDEGEG